jgi:hypothetical protein
LWPSERLYISDSAAYPAQTLATSTTARLGIYAVEQFDVRGELYATNVHGSGRDSYALDPPLDFVRAVRWVLPATIGYQTDLLDFAAPSRSILSATKNYDVMRWTRCRSKRILYVMDRVLDFATLCSYQRAFCD